MRTKAVKWINWIREQEMRALERWLEPLAGRSAKLLEIGGGNGYLAKILTNMGFEVVSIDQAPREPSYFPVQVGDSTVLEFADASFDIIFSSNVLEHVVNLTPAFGEMKRVLKSNGLMIHTMPTPFNSVLTLLAQPIGYFFGVAFVINQAVKLVSSAFNRPLAVKQTGANKVGQCKHIDKQNISQALKMINPLRLFISPPHGTSSSIFAELRDWKPEMWKERFEHAGFSVKEVINLPLTYSRHVVLPFKFVGIRRRLAQAGKTSCVAYILQC